MPNYLDNTRPQQQFDDEKDLDLSLFDAYKQIDQSVVDYSKMKLIKESYPEDYKIRLEKNYQVLEDKVKKLR